MTEGREAVLARIRSALRDVSPSEDPAGAPVQRAYRRAGEKARDQVLDLFEERVSDYRAVVRRVGPSEIGAAVRQACEEWRLRRLGIPPALPHEWRPPDLQVAEDEGQATDWLASLDGVLTGCAAAIAQTGTLVLDGQGVCGRRALTLVPDHHICVVAADQVVELVPEGIARVAPAVVERRLPITLISGPSASSDIELTRVEGVHGPRNLLVLLVT
jgi:L-lactate dehydrogenase complex protein LldG